MAPAYTVRTRGPVTTLWLAAAAAREALGTPAGAAFVAASLRRRLVRQGYATGATDIGTTPVSAIMAPSAWIAADAPVREALERLSDPGTRALVIGAASPLAGGTAMAMVDDAAVRQAAARGRLSADAPVASLATGPAATVEVGKLAVEAAVDMLAAGADSVLVLDGPRVVGTLSAADLVGLEAQSPIALRQTILAAADEDGLVRSASHLPRLFRLLGRAGVPPRDLGRVLSLAQDAIVTRLCDLAIARLGPVGRVTGEELAWAWLDLGSAARRELTLASDQDNALAYADPPAGREGAADAYFAQLGAEVNAGLQRCGFHADPNGVLAARPLWRMAKSAWIRTFDACFSAPDESQLLRATVAFDFRPATGGLAVAAELADRIRVARGSPDFMRLMARSAAGFPVALNRRGRLATGTLDAPAGRLDLKRGAVIPLVNLVRYHALAAGVTISPTPDRITAAAALGALDAETAAALAEAWRTICSVRLGHHGRLIDEGREPDNLLDPGELAPIAASELTEALRQVRRAQHLVEIHAGR
jgi:CBS domain-containing protein